MLVRPLFSAALAFAVLHAGCSLIAGVDRDSITQLVGAGGQGAAPTGSGGQGGAGASTTTGAAGAGGSMGTCANSELDGDETDVDCGGSCPPCVDGEMCMDFADCEGQFCAMGVCGVCMTAGDCTAATGTYCDLGGNCVPKEANGTPCSGASECQSGLCVDGYCCNVACDQLCQSCMLTGTEGSCTPIPTGTDPDNECSGMQNCDALQMCAN